MRCDKKDDDIARAVGAALKRERKRAGVNQTNLAQIMGYKSKSGISNLESGYHTFSIETAFRFASVLGFPVARLFVGLDGGFEVYTPQEFAEKFQVNIHQVEGYDLVLTKGAFNARFEGFQVFAYRDFEELSPIIFS